MKEVGQVGKCVGNHGLGTYNERGGHLIQLCQESSQIRSVNFQNQDLINPNMMINRRYKNFEKIEKSKIYLDLTSEI